MRKIQKFPSLIHDNLTKAHIAGRSALMFVINFHRVCKL